MSLQDTDNRLRGAPDLYQTWVNRDMDMGVLCGDLRTWDELRQPEGRVPDSSDRLCYILTQCQASTNPKENESFTQKHHD
jgi:hypothetical protein